MKKLNFIKTLVSKENFKEREVVGNITFIRLDANEQADGMVLATECSIPTCELDESELSIQYEAWKEKVQAAALEQAKKAKIAEIIAYDTSSSVNGFLLNGLLVWLDKATRVGLMNSTTIAKAAGQETTTLWLGGLKLVVDCDKAIQLLSALEMYALECFNVTASHKAAVNELTTVEEVETYDYKAGYPKMLEMSV